MYKSNQMMQRQSNRRNYASNYVRGNRAVARSQRLNAKRSMPIVYRPTLEKKGMDTPLSGDIVATTNTNETCYPVNLVAPGNGSYNRVGRKISMKSVRLKGLIALSYYNADTTGEITGTVIRMVLVYDKQPSGVLPNFDTVFGRTNQSGTESTQYLDPLKYDNMNRFQVLRDCCYTLNPVLANSNSGTTDVTNLFAEFDEYVKLGGRETVYSGQSSPCTIADISSGGLYVYFRALASIEGQIEPFTTNITYARLRYTD